MKIHLLDTSNIYATGDYSKPVVALRTRKTSAVLAAVIFINLLAIIFVIIKGAPSRDVMNGSIHGTYFDMSFIAILTIILMMQLFQDKLKMGSRYFSTPLTNKQQYAMIQWLAVLGTALTNLMLTFDMLALYSIIFGILKLVTIIATIYSLFFFKKQIKLATDLPSDLDVNTEFTKQLITNISIKHWKYAIIIAFILNCFFSMIILGIYETAPTTPLTTGLDTMMICCIGENFLAGNIMVFAFIYMTRPLMIENQDEVAVINHRRIIAAQGTICFYILGIIALAILSKVL